MPESVTPLIAVGVVIVLFIVLLSALTNNCSLNGIKSKTVGDGQHGTARWATTQEVKKTFANVPFDVASWRAGKNLPEVQGLILGSTQRGKQLDMVLHADCRYHAEGRAGRGYHKNTGVFIHAAPPARSSVPNPRRGCSARI